MRLSAPKRSGHSSGQGQQKQIIPVSSQLRSSSSRFRPSVPISEVRHAWISRLTNFRIDEDTSKALFSSVVCGSEVRSGDDPQYGGLRNHHTRGHHPLVGGSGSSLLHRATAGVRNLRSARRSETSPACQRLAFAPSFYRRTYVLPPAVGTLSLMFVLTQRPPRLPVRWLWLPKSSPRSHPR